MRVMNVQFIKCVACAGSCSECESHPEIEIWHKATAAAALQLH